MISRYYNSNNIRRSLNRLYNSMTGSKSTIIRQFAQHKQYRAWSSATLSSVEKLQMAIEKYRVENYSQELPSRCKKEIINAIHVNNDDHVDEDGLVRILQNIGAGGSILKSDLHNIFKELGDAQNHTISVSDLFKIL